MHIVDGYMKSRYFAAMKGNYSKKYLSVPLWGKSVTNNIFVAQFVDWSMDFLVLDKWVSK